MYYPREAEKDHLYNRVILLTIACCVLLAFAFMARGSGVIYGAIHLSPTEAVGTVAQIERFEKNSRFATIHYTYTDHDGQVHENSYFDAYYDEHPAYDVGGPIDIQYSAWFPSVSSLSSALHTYRMSFYIMATALLLVLLFLGISAWTINRIASMKAADRVY